MGATERPQLGDWCLIAAEAIKSKKPWTRGIRRVEWVTRHVAPPRRMMYVGWRTVYDGDAEWIGEEEGTVFTQRSDHEVWLFVESVRKNPIRAFPKDVMRSPAATE